MLLGQSKEMSWASPACTGGPCAGGCGATGGCCCGGPPAGASCGRGTDAALPSQLPPPPRSPPGISVDDPCAHGWGALRLPPPQEPAGGSGLRATHLLVRGLLASQVGLLGRQGRVLGRERAHEVLGSKPRPLRRRGRAHATAAHGGPRVTAASATLTCML